MCNAVSRVLWGFLVDKSTCKVCRRLQDKSEGEALPFFTDGFCFEILTERSGVHVAGAECAFVRLSTGASLRALGVRRVALHAVHSVSGSLHGDSCRRAARVRLQVLQQQLRSPRHILRIFISYSVASNLVNAIESLITSFVVHNLTEHRRRDLFDRHTIRLSTCRLAQSLPHSSNSFTRR